MESHSYMKLLTVLGMAFPNKSIAIILLVGFILSWMNSISIQTVFVTTY